MVALRDRTREAHRRDQGAAQRGTAADAIPKGTTSARRVEDCLREVAAASRAEPSSWKQRWRRSPVSASGKRWTSLRRRGRGRGSPSAKSFRRTATSFWRIATPSGAPLEPRIIVDNKDKSIITEGDIEKLIRDARRTLDARCGIIVARDESQLRQHDREAALGPGRRRLDSADNTPMAAARPRSAQARSSSGCEPRVRTSCRRTPRWRKKFGARSLTLTRSRAN